MPSKGGGEGHKRKEWREKGNQNMGKQKRKRKMSRS
jgi:hypothetical protein